MWRRKRYGAEAPRWHAGKYITADAIGAEKEQAAGTIDSGETHRQRQNAGIISLTRRHEEAHRVRSRWIVLPCSAVEFQAEDEWTEVKGAGRVEPVQLRGRDVGEVAMLLVVCIRREEAGQHNRAVQYAKQNPNTAAIHVA